MTREIDIHQLEKFQLQNTKMSSYSKHVLPRPTYFWSWSCFLIAVDPYFYLLDRFRVGPFLLHGSVAAKGSVYRICLASDLMGQD